MGLGKSKQKTPASLPIAQRTITLRSCFSGSQKATTDLPNEPVFPAAERQFNDDLRPRIVVVFEVVPVVRTGFRFDKWNVCRGLGRQADWRQAVFSVVSLIGRHAVKARVRAAAIAQRGLRTPTGPFFARFSIRIIRGRADKCACTRRSTSLMTFFSVARWKVRKRIDGWRSQPGCSIAPDVLNRRP